MALLVIPYDQLSPPALAGVIDDFVTREGTDYGHSEHSLEQKCAQVRRQLERGEAVVVFDAESESVSLVLRRELAAQALEEPRVVEGD